jgi:hypothetical protein
MVSEGSQSEGVELEPDAAAIPVDGDALTEDIALSLLKRGDIGADEIEQISKNIALMKSRKVRVSVAAHARTPRRIALRLIRELYTVELMQFSLRPGAPADLRRVADQQLITRLPSITLGERIALARRCSAIVCAALVCDKEPRVWQTALQNPRLTQTAVVRALMRAETTAAFVEAICRDEKWSVRPEIRIALLSNAHTPLGRALAFARGLTPTQLRDLLRDSRLPEKIKEYLRRDAASISKAKKRTAKND